MWRLNPRTAQYKKRVTTDSSYFSKTTLSALCHGLKLRSLAYQLSVTVHKKRTEIILKVKRMGSKGSELFCARRGWSIYDALSHHWLNCRKLSRQALFF